MLFGPRLTTVFASRWKAAAWAATILLTAYSIATDGFGLGGGNDQAGSAAQSAGQPAPQSTLSPWAPDSGSH